MSKTQKILKAVNQKKLKASNPKKLKAPYQNLPPLVDVTQLAKLLGLSDISICLPDLEKMNIRNVELAAKSVSADVDVWKAQVRYRGETVEGECNCPESDGFEFCTHCAALCLHTNKQLQKISALDKGPDKSKVMAYLLTQDKQVLANSLLEFISEDAEQLDRYLIKATLNRTEIDYAQLKTRITDLTKTNERLFSQRQVKHFFSKIERLLEEFSMVEVYPEPEKMLKLIEYAVQRIGKLLETLEDNTGQRNCCVEKLRELYTRLFSEIGGRDDTKLKRLLPLWLSDRYDILPQDLEEELPESLFELFVEALKAELKALLSNNSASQSLGWQCEKLIYFLKDLADSRGEEEASKYYRELLSVG